MNTANTAKARKIHKIQKWMSSAIILSEASHVFCCVLPTVFSVVSMLAGLGMIGAMPYWLQSVHDVMHKWELPMIGLAGTVIVLGWALHWISLKLDSHHEHCHHGGCTPKRKSGANLILKAATLLFVVNLGVYFGFHRNSHIQDAIHAHQHEMHELEAHSEAVHDHGDH